MECFMLVCQQSGVNKLTRHPATASLLSGGHQLRWKYHPKFTSIMLAYFDMIPLNIHTLFDHFTIDILYNIQSIPQLH